MDRDNIDLQAEQIADLIVAAKRIVIFTGAGISTESGIPDFRGKDGIWTRLDPEDFTIQRFISSPEVRKMQWKMLSEGGMVKDVKPNAAHYAVAELEKLGKLDCVVTQNIDNLHQVAGNSPDIVLSCTATCSMCGAWDATNVFPWRKLSPGCQLRKCRPVSIARGF